MGKGAFGHPDGHPLRESPTRYGPERGAFGHEMAKKEVPFAGQKADGQRKKHPPQRRPIGGFGHEMAKREGPKSPPPLGKEIGLRHFSTTPHPIVEK